MSGVFDRLGSKLQTGEGEGLSPSHIATLPPAQRKIVRLLLRELELSYQAICDAMMALPDGERLNKDEIDEALKALALEGWVIRMGDTTITYEVNMRRKAPSTLAKAIWSALDSRISDSKLQK
jgi:hypothetical protein